MNQDSPELHQPPAGCGLCLRRNSVGRVSLLTRTLRAARYALEGVLQFAQEFVLLLIWVSVFYFIFNILKLLWMI